MKKNKILPALLIASLIITTISASGCRTKTTTTKSSNKKITLTYYKLFDNTDVMQPIIDAYQKKHPNVTINYKKFTDFDNYTNTVLNEMASGEGPDIFSMQNTWFASNYKKISPLNKNLASVEDFKNEFVDVAVQDLVRPNENGYLKIYGIPLTVDTLALYYNKDQFNDAIPEQGKPSKTWEGIKEDVSKLNKTDKSFDRFAISGIALGTNKNITRAVDIIYLLLLQNDVNFYNEDRSKILINTSDNRKKLNKAIKLYKSFADPKQKNYSWNTLTADENSDEKEIEAFAKGEVSMILGYSYTYDQILNYIKIYKEKGIDTIDKDAIQITEAPQLYDPSISTKKRITYANYFAETVSRNSKNADEAWKFLMFASEQENLEKYFEKTHKPTSIKKMIETQSKDPIYGVFAKQIGYSESFPITDYKGYKEAFEETIGETNPNLESLYDKLKTYLTKDLTLQETKIEVEENTEK